MMVFLHGWSRLQCLCMLLTLSTVSSNTMPNFLIGTDGAEGVGLGVGLGGFMAPGNLDEINSGCWDSSCLTMIQTRRLRLADSRGALWDFMTYLRASQRQKHNELFLELTQHWAMYVDCMLSRAHGLGKRGFTTTLSELRVMEVSPNDAQNNA
ncbi:protein FAM237B-like [Salvelinus alpinus]|uniref:protein FAM237B-like n=1 Tax=Salvelinus sp. IW2-2015 TaxID=2691554 RepID=UPI0038D4FC19